MSQKTFPCRNNCGAEIYLDGKTKSTSGKLIPIDSRTNQPHQCPNSQWSQNKQKVSPGGGAPKIDLSAAVADIYQKLEQLRKDVAELQINRWRS